MTLPIQVPCPFCRAKPRERCFTAAWRTPLADPHTARRKAAAGLLVDARLPLYENGEP